MDEIKKMMTGSNKTDDEKKKINDQIDNMTTSIDELMDKASAGMSDVWDDFCDTLEETDNDTIQWISKNFLRRLSIEAPVVVSFVFACSMMHIISYVLPEGSIWLGVDDFFDPTNPMHFLRQFTHIFMHDGIQHLRNNMTHMLLVGPSSEAVFGSINLIYIILVVAISSAWAHILIGQPHTRQLGASGVCFAVILLNSLVSASRGKIPVSFILTALWWLGDELINLLFSGDNVSHHAHLVGGIVGAAAGYYLRTQQSHGTETSTSSKKNDDGAKVAGFLKKLLGAGDSKTTKKKD